MTLQQIRYLVAIEQHGSLSKAAESLFVSQPNLSSAIKNLESELNLKIIKRNNRGVAFTNEGVRVLKHAKSIVSQLSDIQNIHSEKKYTTLKITAHLWSTFNFTFSRFASESLENNNINIEYTNTAGRKLIKQVYQQNVDLGLDIVFEEHMIQYKQYINDRNITFIPLIRLPIILKFRKNHPILKSTHFFEDLNKYPITRFKIHDKPYEHDILSSPHLKYVDFENTIVISDSKLRREIILSTNAYGLGLVCHPNDIEINDFARVIVPDMYCIIGYLHNNNAIFSREAESFIEMLNDEIHIINNLSFHDIYISRSLNL